MKALRFLLEKEFRQVFRDPAMLRMMFIMPVKSTLLSGLVDLKMLRLSLKLMIVVSEDCWASREGFGVHTPLPQQRDTRLGLRSLQISGHGSGCFASYRALRA